MALDSGLVLRGPRDVTGRRERPSTESGATRRSSAGQGPVSPTAPTVQGEVSYDLLETRREVSEPGRLVGQT